MKGTYPFTFSRPFTVQYMRVCIYLRDVIVSEIMRVTGRERAGEAVREILLRLLAEHGTENLQVLAKAELLEEEVERDG